MSLPLIRLEGDPRTQGRQHGEALRERIAANLEIYFRRFRNETMLEADAVLAIARQWIAALERQSPAYVAGMQGVSEGSGFDVERIAALNARYEILYYQFGKLAMAKAESAGDGCTAFLCLPETTESGHLLMGQNWDWIPEVRGAVLHTVEEDGFETLAFTEAGIVGAKIGLNAAGLGIAINGITTTDDDWSRLNKPFHARAWEILRCRTLNDAVAVIASEPRCCSTNFALGCAPDGAVDVEAAPDVHNLLYCIDGIRTHANHFVDPDGLGIVEPPNERRIYSRRREARLRDLLMAARPLTVAKIQEALRDTRDDPFGLSRHRNPAEPPDQHYTTVTGVVMDLNARVAHFTDGPPDLAPFETFRL